MCPELYKNHRLHSEHSLLMYLCDAFDYCTIEDLPVLLTIVREDGYVKTKWFNQMVAGFDNIKTVEELRTASKKLRKDLL